MTTLPRLTPGNLEEMPSIEGEADLCFLNLPPFLVCENLRRLRMVSLPADFRRRRELEKPIAPSHAFSGALNNNGSSVNPSGKARTVDL